VGSPTPDPNRNGCGRGFHFSPTGALETQKKSIISAQRPGPTTFSRSLLHTVISIKAAYPSIQPQMQPAKQISRAQEQPPNAKATIGHPAWPVPLLSGVGFMAWACPRGLSSSRAVLVGCLDHCWRNPWFMFAFLFA
jgi:hypothetical protein